MIAVEVYRGSGERPGGEVRDPLIGDSLPVALARGRAELDANAHTMERVELESAYRPDSTLGELIEIDDPVQGVTWRGQVIGIAHRLDGAELITVLTVRRPL